MEASQKITIKALAFMVFIPLAQASHENKNNLGVILCIAERNAIRMERYSLEQFNQEVVYLTKKDRDEHCFLDLAMRHDGSNVLGLHWDQEMPGYLAIETGKRTAPVIYYANMFSLFEVNDARLQEAVAMCLDSVVAPIAKNNPIDQQQANTIWVTAAQLQIDTEHHKTCTAVFDRRIKSLCCMLVPEALFEYSLRFDKKLTKDEALANGLLYYVSPTHDPKLDELMRDQNTGQLSARDAQPSVTQVVQDVQHAVQTTEQTVQAAEQTVQDAEQAAQAVVQVAQDVQQEKTWLETLLAPFTSFAQFAATSLQSLVTLALGKK